MRLFLVFVHSSYDLELKDKLPQHVEGISFFFLVSFKASACIPFNTICSFLLQRKREGQRKNFKGMNVHYDVVSITHP